MTLIGLSNVSISCFAFGLPLYRFVTWQKLQLISINKLITLVMCLFYGTFQMCNSDTDIGRFVNYFSYPFICLSGKKSVCRELRLSMFQCIMIIKGVVTTPKYSLKAGAIQPESFCCNWSISENIMETRADWWKGERDCWPP